MVFHGQDLETRRKALQSEFPEEIGGLRVDKHKSRSSTVVCEWISAQNGSRRSWRHTGGLPLIPESKCRVL